MSSHHDVFTLLDAGDYPAAVRCDPRLGADKNTMLKAVAMDGIMLEYGSLAIIDDPEVVSVAVANNGMALRCAGTDAKRYEGIAKLAVSNNGMALQHVPFELLTDEIVKSAVLQSGLALQFARPHQRDHAGIVLAAIRQNPASLQYASPGLQDQLAAEARRILADIETGKVEHADSPQFAMSLDADGRISREELARVGIALNGGRSHGWKTNLAACLNDALGTSYSPQRIVDWMRGDRQIPRQAARALADLVAGKGAKARMGCIF